MSFSRRQLAEARRKIKEQARKYQSIFLSAGEGIFLSTPDGRLIEANPAFVAVFGCKDMAELMGFAGASLHNLYRNPEDRHLLVEQAMAHGRDIGREVRMRRFDGQIFWARISVTRHVDQETGEEMMLGVLQDVTAQRQNLLDLEFRATRDALTGLPNRYLFTDRLSQALANAKRHEWRVGVLFIDLNDFKKINDQYGHQVGDLVLQKVGERILRRTREADTAARIGGDEFAVILDQVKDAESAAKVAWALGATIRRPYEENGVEYSVGASIGVCIFPDDGCDPREIIRLADEAMYRAKAQGRDFCYCSELTGGEAVADESDRGPEDG